MSSGPKWSLRNGSQYQRLCARPGCGAPASVTLRFQPTQRQAWLVELDEHSARTQGDLCNRHAESLVLPRGWELHDERIEAPDADGNSPVAKNTNGKGVRRVRVRRKVPPVGTPAVTGSLPGFEPEAGDRSPATPVAHDAAGSSDRGAPRTDARPGVPQPADASPVDDAGEAAAEAQPAATPVVRFGAHDDEDVEQALGAILDARTPLLQRAFRNSKPL
jgi:hypothetical protein